jgi:hypothetical protein
MHTSPHCQFLPYLQVADDNPVTPLVLAKDVCPASM